MHIYPKRTSEKSSNCCTYTLLVIDALFAVILDLYGLLFIMDANLLGIPFLLVTLIKSLGVYNSFACLLHPEKVKPNRTYYLFFSVVNVSLNLSLALFSVGVIISVFFESDIDQFELLVYSLLFLITSLLSVSGWTNLFYI